jgi:ribosomal protein S20
MANNKSAKKRIEINKRNRLKIVIIKVQFEL